ncbi:cytosine permease [Mycolicibacterium sp. P9-64]|uniref:purine-cytosine permease family protein n=1 Tax=Mycolicibacterium sp. P9-64 TaxID=2024612 RepID=UPI0011EC3EC7|nr:cytosine permease [Mycolicibacterium sp. P9-64]KAA0084569.1 cytosine permease [Mycolicibacterium sp. P9-64]
MPTSSNPSGSDDFRNETRPTGLIETRSIDYVPLRERKGRLTDQATIWFAGSAQLLSLATGAIGIGLGLNLVWTLVALAVGTVIGTIPVSAHATQGPHLGLPQMVQTRPQFGRYGALFIWVVAIVVYWGYIVLGGNLLGVTAEQLGWGSAQPWAVITGLACVVLAVFGYHWLHVAQRVITIALVVVLVIYVIGLVVGGLIPAGAFTLSGTFDLAPFLIVVSAATSYQLSWAFFVSDYSRYMPPDTPRRAIVAWTSAGLFFGVFSFEAVGAVCAAMLPADGIIPGLATTGDLVFKPLGATMLITGGLGLLGLMAMCVYGGSLTLITALDSVRPVTPTRRIRVVTILLVGVTATVAGALLPADFLNTSFATILAVLAYLMAPWTAINLTDFFLVRRGRYSVTEMFKPDGIYGTWNLRGIAAYAVTFVVMIPFMNLSFFQGPIAAAMGGIDVAFFVGIPVGGAIYWLLCRNLNLDREHAVIEQSDGDLEARAEAII